MERWLRQQRPEIYTRLTNANLPESLHETIMLALASDNYRHLPVWGESTETIQTDLLIITSQFSPDMLKDVIAIRSQRPGIHCTLVMGPMWWGQKELATKYFDEIIEYGNEGIVRVIEILNNISARSTIIRGARTHLDVVIEIFCSGRRIFRSEEWNCAVPGYDPLSEVALIERYLVEHTCGIYHYWDKIAADTIRNIFDVKVPIETIMPACVDELGPFEYLPKLSEIDGDPHTVFAGDLLFDQGGMPEHLGKWEMMCAQGIHVHFYPPRPQWILSKRAEPYLALQKRTRFFHIEQTIDFERVLVEFTKYDWAYYHIDDFSHRYNTGFEIMGSNLYFTFVQAGLPAIAAPTSAFQYLNRLIDEFAIGFVVDSKDIPDMRSKMASVMTEDMPDRLNRFRDVMAFKREALANLVLPTPSQKFS